MSKQRIPTQLDFRALGKREVAGRFDGGRIPSYASAVHVIAMPTQPRAGAEAHLVALNPIQLLQ